MTLQKDALATLRIDRPAESEGSGQSRVWLWLVFVLLLLGGGGALWLLSSRPVAVRTAIARLPDTAGGAEGSTGTGQATVLNASGYVTARRQATVSSKATGKVVEVMLEEGMKVEAGQVLARLDTSNVEASLRLAEAQLAAAQGTTGETKALLDRAQLDLKRIRSLAEQRIASPSDLDRADAEVKSLQARLAQQEQEKVVAERQVAVWRQEMEDRVIRAPFAGVVISKNAQPGEMISPISAGGGFIRTGIGTLVDMTSLEIEVDVNESYINRVSAGQPVTAKLDAYADWEIPGKVIAIIPTADRQKATVKVRIGFNQLDPRILPDMGVKVAFRAESAAGNSSSSGSASGSQSGTRPGAGVRVPLTALRQSEGRDIIWVVRNEALERRGVKWIKGPGQEEASVQAGLTAGERVVVEAPAILVEGTRVTEKKP